MAKKNAKPRLVLLRGLPASGKSTRAEELVILEDNFVRVNKDKIREMMSFIGRGEKKRERYAHEGVFEKAEIAVARAALQEGMNVVVDDTNLKDYHVDLWKKVAYSESANFEVESFLDVDVEECVRRDAARPDGVGRGVIYSMAAAIRRLESRNKKIDAEEYGIVDMDGTLCDIDHRLHYIQNGNADWDNFHAAMAIDTPRDHVISLVRDSYPDLPWVVCTGRHEPYREVCEEWLDKHVRSQGIKVIGLLMREDCDKRPDNVVKGEFLEKYLNKDNCKIVIDDRPVVVRMWQASGLPVINVGEKVEF